ncbi:MAG TPA: hypothetical protein VE953_22250 [Terriglobales bacterium]|nr:hypothetical protein [Candidatus Dormibacteraeota bacterium]HYW26907.1 hypothetical protein [Terriglobales bacterium]
MTSASTVIDSAAGRRPVRGRVLRATPWFEWAAVALSTAVVVGAHVDSWAHGHVAATLETFFTPWHALLYASLAATMAFLVVCAAWTGARPWEWARALPDGYALSLAGCVLFGIGGVLDLAWHLTFGIERGFQALISPTHLILIGSAGLIVSGPLRAAWRRPGRAIGGPAIASATLTLTVLTFFGQFDHPFTSQWAALPQTLVPAQPAEELGMLGIIFQTGLLMGVILLLVRRFDLPFGTLTFLLGVNAVFVTLINAADPIILIGVAAGFVADVAYALLRPSPKRTVQVRAFAFLVPTVLYAMYFAGLIRVDGVWWPIHLWAGAPVVAGLAGWLVSLGVIPPRVPEESEATTLAA